MKTLLILFSTLTAPLLFGATVDVTATSSSRTAIPVPGSNEDQLVLHSDNYYTYSVAARQTATYQSMQAVKGSGDTQTIGDANFAIGTLVIDANTASGNFEAVNINTFSINYFDFIVKNTAIDNTANIILNFNKLDIRSFSTAVAQHQNFSLENVKATVNAKTTNLANDTLAGGEPNTSIIAINANSEVTWNGNLNAEKYAKLNINGKFITNTGSYTYKSGSAVTIGSNGEYSLRSASSATVQSEALFDLSSGGTFTQEFGATFNMNGTMKCAKAITFAKMSTAGTFTQSVNDSSYGVTLTRPTNFNEGANWTAYYRLILAGSSMSELTLANVTINEGANIAITRMASQPTSNPAIIMKGNAALTINEENAFSDGEGGNVAVGTYSGTANNKLILNSSQTFDWIFANSSDIDIIMADGATLQLTSSAQAIQIGGDALINIYNFLENSIYVGNDSNVARLVTSNVKLFDSFNFDLGTAYVNDSGFITLIAVPEPAEWAIIFGVAALGIVLYSRRK